MSNDRQASRKPKKSERGKLLLIPVLGAVLLFVLLDSDDSTEPPELEPEAATEISAQSVDDPPPQSAAVPAWPEHPLERILAHDPFFPHEASGTVQADAEPSAPTVDPAELARGLKVSAIFRGPRGMTAIVDGRPVRVGDELTGGLFVTRIDAQGIEVTLQASAAESEGPD